MKKKSKTYDWSEVTFHLMGKQIPVSGIKYYSPFSGLSIENLEKELKSAEKIEDYETCQIIKNIIDEKTKKKN